jgi:hypothetical protein
MMAAQGLNQNTECWLYDDRIPKYCLKRVASGSRYLVLLPGSDPELWQRLAVHSLVKTAFVASSHPIPKLLWLLMRVVAAPVAIRCLA